MLNWNHLQNILIIAIACSTITVAFVQKTKKFCRNSRCITWYSFVVNMIFGVLFSLSFSNIDKINSLWVGLFSFIGADTIYRNLEGKLSSYTELIHNQVNHTSDTYKSNPNNNDDVIGEIKYE